MTSHLDTRFEHYRTGVERLDAEHYNLLVLMETIADNADAPIEEVQLQITAVVLLFEQHQRDEEAYMDSIDYPFAAYHKQHHAEFLQMLYKFKQSPPTHAMRYTTHSLSNHFFAHIDEHDIQMAQYAKHRKQTTN